MLYRYYKSHYQLQPFRAFPKYNGQQQRQGDLKTELLAVARMLASLLIRRAERSRRSRHFDVQRQNGRLRPKRCDGQGVDLLVALGIVRLDVCELGGVVEGWVIPV